MHGAIHGIISDPQAQDSQHLRHRARWASAGSSLKMPRRDSLLPRNSAAARASSFLLQWSPSTKLGILTRGGALTGGAIRQAVQAARRLNVQHSLRRRAAVFKLGKQQMNITRRNGQIRKQKRTTRDGVFVRTSFASGGASAY